MPPRRRSLGLEVGAYLYVRRRARSGKRLRKLFLTPCRSACRRLREGSATKAPRGFIKPTGRSAIKSLPGIRQSGHSHWWKKPGAARICEVARLKEILEHSLKSINPASVHQIAADLGYANEGYIRQKFPALCVGNQQESISDEANSFSEDSPDPGRRAQ